MDLVVALIVFGPRKLPEIGKSLGRMMGEFRRASNEFKSTIDALKLQASESNLNGLKEQYEMALDQSEAAKTAVQQNAMRVSELAAKRMELLGSLEAAKMQESVNEAVDAMSNMSDYEAVSLDKVEEKIEKRKAQAMGQAEVFDVTPEGGEIELRQALNEAQADAKLEELKAELGLTDVAEPAPAPEAEGEASGTTS